MNFLLLLHTYFLYYIKKRVKHFYNNNLGIHRMIIYFTVCLCIIKIKKVIFLAQIYYLLLFDYYSKKCLIMYISFMLLFLYRYFDVAYKFKISWPKYLFL